MTTTSAPISEERSSTNRWLLILWSLTIIIVGGFLVFRPAPTALFWVQVMAIFWLIGGIWDIVGSLMQRGDGWGWQLTGGIISLLAGLYIVGSPLVGAVVLIQLFFFLLVFSAIFNGIVNVFRGIRAPRSWGQVVLGALQVFIGGWLLFQPLVGMLALVPTFGIIMIAGGIISLVFSFTLN